MEYIDIKHLIAAVIYTLVGLVAFAGSFLILDKLTPADLYQEIVQKQNRALALLDNKQICPIE